MNNKINEKLPADIRAYFGSTGSGKTHNIKNDIRDDKRVLCFDPDGSFSAADGFQIVTDRAQFLSLARNSGNIKLCFAAGGVPNFEFFCSVVWALADARRPMTCVVDELAGVTSAGKAKGDWHPIVARGRKYGIKVRADSQRPSEIDKTLMGNQTGLWVGFQAREGDAKYLANEMSVDIEKIKGLRGKPYFDFIGFKNRNEYTINQK
jgi:hypothetical protein